MERSRMRGVVQVVGVVGTGGTEPAALVFGGLQEAQRVVLLDGFPSQAEERIGALVGRRALETVGAISLVEAIEAGNLLGVGQRGCLRPGGCSPYNS